MRSPQPGRSRLVAVVALAAAALVMLLVWSKRRDPDPPARQVAGERQRGGPGISAADPLQPAADAAIEGRVLDPDGVGVEGAMVAALRQFERGEPSARPMPQRVVRSEKNGRFRLGGLGPGRYGVGASAPKLTSAFVGDIRLANETISGVEVRLRRDGVTLSGRVLDTGSGTIPGAKIRAVHWLGTPGPSGPLGVVAFEALADGTGAFELRLPKGRYGVDASFDGYTTTGDLFELASDTSRDFRLEPAARIAGRVLTAEGRAPVAGAQVTAEASERRLVPPAEPVTTDDQGAFQLGSLSAGTYQIRARKGALVGALGQPVTVAVASTTTDVEVLVAPGLSLQGTIKSSDGKPIANAQVALWPNDPRGPIRSRSQARSDQQGRYLLEGLEPGPFRVHASAETYSDHGDELTLARSETRDFVLRDGVVLKGVVLTSAGQPAPGAELEARVRPTERSGTGTADRALTDDTGRFELKRLVPGEVTLSIKHRADATEHGPEPLAAGERKEIVVKLAPGARVSGTLTWDDGPAAPGIKIIGTSRGGGMLRVETETGPDGRFDVGPFPAGRISVVAMPPGERIGWSSQPRPEQVDLTVTAGEQKTGVKLVASRRNGVIKGLVVDPTGRPVDGAVIHAGLERDGRASKSGPSGGRATSGTDGTFTMADLTKGTYTLWASHPTFAEAELTGAALGSEVMLQLRPGASLAGEVVDAAGRPIPRYSLALVAGKPGDSAAQRARRMNSFDNQTLQVNDPRGAFRVERLAPGIYDLVATSPDGSVVHATGIVLADGEDKRGIRLVTESGVTLSGRVIEYESGQPLAGVQIRVRTPSGRGPEGKTGADGTFTVANVPRLPGVSASIEAPDRSHVPEFYSLPAPRDGRIDLGTTRMLKYDAKNPGRGRMGISYHERDGKIVIGDVAADSPAARAGLLKGDVVISVDGKATIDVAEISRAMRTDPDKVVTVTVQSPGQQPREIKLKRAL